MKMNYELKNEYANRKSKNKPIIFVITFLLAVLIVHIIKPSLIPGVFSYLFSPFWKVESDIRYGNEYINHADLIKKIDQMERDMDNQDALIKSYQVLKKENEDLKAILNRKENKNLILAQILKKPPYSFYDTLIVDVGEKDKIEKGNLVYIGATIPIGTVDEVYANTSKIKLYSTPKEKFDALVGPKNIEITAFGKGAGVFEAQLPRDAFISEGDTVSIPSISNSFVGVVKKIVFEPSSPFSTILFSQQININELKWVEISINNK
jgi:cell shape-determining protein MreC